MWQRIQTVFLAIAVVSLIASIFLPVWGFQADDGTRYELYPLHYTITVNGVRTTQYFPYCLTAILAIASATLALIEIRRFDNRMLQMKLGVLNSFFMAGTIAAGVLFSNGFTQAHPNGSYGYGLWVPGIAVLCNFLANRFIRRDEKLVRDSNRLR